LLSKASSELIANMITEFDNFEYSVCKGKFILTWNSGTLITTCETNEYQNVFHNFSKFFDESELLFSFSLEKQEILKSLKFIGNISNSHIVEFNFSSLSLVLTSKSNDRGGALDKIVLAEPAPDLKVSYLSNHLTKVLEVLNEKIINFNIYNYNDFNLLMVECTNFKHLIFPME
jgi:DNA polymerase III sliding clamp (beta) subunit (PCNA family)